jgi:hypothetical protein
MSVKGVAAGTDETAQQVQPVGQEPGPKGLPALGQPTPEELALARKIVARMEGDPTYKKHTLLGYRDSNKLIQAALCAIQQTTELAAVYLESVAMKRSDHMKVEALRRNVHLGDV